MSHGSHCQIPAVSSSAFLEEAVCFSGGWIQQPCRTMTNTLALVLRATNGLVPSLEDFTNLKVCTYCRSVVELDKEKQFYFETSHR